MPTPNKNLPSVKECIAYVESLGYTYQSKVQVREFGGYWFKINDKSTRPPHNWDMTWTLGDMRHAVKNGC